MGEFDNNNSKWWKPENLEKKETKFRSGKIKLTSDDDFGSYKIMLDSDNISRSNIQSHNDLNPESKIKMVKTFIEENIPKNKFDKIFNVGCGLGYETKFLAKVFSSKALGIDISLDAIKYARNFFSNENINFERITVDKNLKLDSKFNAAFAFEFYPFTRNNDKEFQLSILKALFNNLSDKGCVVIYQLYENKESIRDNIEYLSMKLKKKYLISGRVHPRIYKITNSFIITNFLSLFYSLIFNKKDVSKRIIIFY